MNANSGVIFFKLFRSIAAKITSYFFSIIFNVTDDKVYPTKPNIPYDSYATLHRQTQKQYRTTHYAPPDFRGRSVRFGSAHSPANLYVLQKPFPIPFSRLRCARPRPIHPYRRHPRPSLDAQPSDPHPGSIPAARRLCHCHPSPGWEIPFAFSKPPSSAPPPSGPMANTATPTAPAFSSPPL